MALISLSCSTPLAERNFKECQPLLEEARQESRHKQRHSYEPGAYNDCRRPARIYVEEMQPE
ncbi:hypothetical protein WDW89_07485 [Deltaproteobacteria bacterium TL4]